MEKTTLNGLATSQTYTESGIHTSTDTGGRTLTYTYDPQYGRLTRITDDLGNYLSYSYDTQGNRIEDSAYNASDIRTRWKRFDYQHPDQPGQLWKVIHPDNSEIVYGYDTLGRVSSVQNERRFSTAYATVTDQSGQSAYAYDIWGHITSESRTNTGMPAAVVSYGHSATTGYPASMTYPGGMVLSYGYDAAGRISSIQANGENVVSNITYRPFGPVEDYTFGNALLTVDQTFNLRDQVDRIKAGAMDYQYSYHAPLPTALFTGATSFAYQAGTNKLDASTGAQTKNYTTDAHGNIISDGTNTFIYDENNRLTKVKQGATTLAQYAYDAQNRVMSPFNWQTIINFIMIDSVRINFKSEAIMSELEQYFCPNEQCKEYGLR
ncbi:MAG: hypothetical protein WC799_18525, partial [Desulfobacteraceae bacterium]